jgi:hypothetical protein
VLPEYSKRFNAYSVMEGGKGVKNCKQSLDGEPSWKDTNTEKLFCMEVIYIASDKT